MGHRSWRKIIEARLQALGANLPPSNRRFLLRDIAGLPEPVRRYFTFAIPDGQPLPALVTLHQAGEMLLGRWYRFTAQSHVRLTPPGFLWLARVRLPLVTVWVQDGYLEGRGTMKASLFGIIPLMAAPNTAEISAASLQRYLAEGPWAPATLLPGTGVTWQPLDANSARATLTDSTTTVSVDFHVGREGEIEEVRADRFRSLKGRQVLTRWIGRFSEYRRGGGMMLPGKGEVGWAPAGKWEPYWRGRILMLTGGGT